MTYEKPEVLEIGAAQEVVLGEKEGNPAEEAGGFKVINPLTDFDE